MLARRRRARRRRAAARLADLLTVTSCAEQLGVTEGALALTAAYATTREQFGRPIGTFQAVSQRLADGFIDTLGQRLTLWQAAWRLGRGTCPRRRSSPAPPLFAADAGHRVAHTAVHVHGGVGIDLDGEAHRYFTAAKRWEFALGGTTRQALTIGRALRGRTRLTSARAVTLPATTARRRRRVVAGWSPAVDRAKAPCSHGLRRASSSQPGRLAP